MLEVARTPTNMRATSRNLVQISLTLSEDGGRPAAVLLADDGPGARRRRGRPPARELLVPPGLAVQLFNLNMHMIF